MGASVGEIGTDRVQAVDNIVSRKRSSLVCEVWMGDGSECIQEMSVGKVDML